ncbi:MAG TPA: hypothetical protein VE990_12780 [Acidimicrobiales bacterium]|nr:hypothetical protein [Acidimicrobiales bacterium]
MPDGAEQARMEAAGDWRRWGPYLSERAWGTVREDYSADGDAWAYFPFEQARSRVYRWSEDGLAGLCDDLQTLCLAFGFWNGADPILKERVFGLSGPQGNHGEDAKEYWFYLDSTPTHSWMRWRYLYPQGAFPYDELVRVNAERGRGDPEYELLDTGAFDGDRYWEITVDYAKADPDDICIRLRARNCGPEPARLDAVANLWFRNKWSFMAGVHRPTVRGDPAALAADDHALGSWALVGDGEPAVLVCDNETNSARLWGSANRSPHPKDAIGDHVVSGDGALAPDGTGTKGALHYRLDVAAGGTAEVRLRLARRAGDLGGGWEAVMQRREQEADQFYAGLIGDAGPDVAAVARQACAGMLWSKQFFHYDVERWLEGDPGQPTPPPQRLEGRNSSWRHLNNHEVISMPDKWEYPWYAAWDLAFHCVTLAHLDPAFAKEQLVLLCREWYMHPNGQLPAYEWSFSDVNPPVHAWAALRVFEVDGRRDFDFLERVLHKLLLNFNWWVNRKDSQGSNVFEGGFLGLDNIGPIDRSAKLPVAGRLEQSDATAWMAMYCLNLLEMSLTLAGHDPTYEDLATKFFEHFTYIASAMNDQGLWDDEDGFYYDLLHLADGQDVSLRVRSMVGLVPLFAVTVVSRQLLDRLPSFAARTRWFLQHKPRFAQVVSHMDQGASDETMLLSIVSPERLRRILARMLDEDEFLSPHGLRSLSAFHRGNPFRLDVAGLQGQVDYEPAESRTPLFGGNSNWRGPVWFPLNYLMTEALRRFHRYLGPGFQVPCPTGSDRLVDLAGVADELSRRLVSIFLDGTDGRRPVFGSYQRFQTDPAWHGLIPFHEYFHGDTGAGLGASHQTGWTGLVADLIIDRNR